METDKKNERRKETIIKKISDKPEKTYDLLINLMFLCIDSLCFSIFCFPYIFRVFCMDFCIFLLCLAEKVMR